MSELTKTDLRRKYTKKKYLVRVDGQGLAFNRQLISDFVKNGTVVSIGITKKDATIRHDPNGMFKIGIYNDGGTARISNLFLCAVFGLKEKEKSKTFTAKIVDGSVVVNLKSKE